MTRREREMERVGKRESKGLRSIKRETDKEGRETRVRREESKETRD